MELTDYLQLVAIILAFLATGASQFMVVKENKPFTCFLNRLTTSGRVLFTIFIVSIISTGYLGWRNLEGNKFNANNLDSIVHSLRNERELARAGDSARLKGSIDLLGISYLSIWIHPALENLSREDSESFRNRLLDFTKKVLEEMRTQSNNIVLLHNQNLYSFWNNARGIVIHERLILYGYNFTSIKKVNQVLQLVGAKLRDMSDNYAKESYFHEQKIDTNLYPEIRLLNDSA